MCCKDKLITIRKEEWAFTPVKGHYEDAGVDLRAPYAIVVPKGGSVTIDTGIMCDIPVGYYGKLESKSGLNVKHDIVSCGGTIDAGYTGHINVKLYNLGDKDYAFCAGDKVVQLIIIPCAIHFDGIKILSDEKRETNGFGSTGR